MQQLTDKLYNEGLAKGRAEAEALLAEARQKAEALLAEAREKAQAIVDEAEKNAERLKTNSENEVRLAATQLRSALRQQIEGMVRMEVVGPKVAEAWRDNAFIKELAVAAVQSIGQAQETKNGEGLRVVLPENRGGELVEAVKQALAERFGAENGIEVVMDAKVRVPFRIQVKEGGYYVSFADGDFDALFHSYLRPKIAELLFGKEENGQ